jgi:hypothetical protein
MAGVRIVNPQSFEHRSLLYLEKIFEGFFFSKSSVHDSPAGEEWFLEKSRVLAAAGAAKRPEKVFSRYNIQKNYFANSFS